MTASLASISASSPHHLPATSIRWWGCSHVGRVRKNNEDAFLGLLFNSQEMHHLGKMGESSLQGHDAVFAVSDGMGGAKAGEFASKIAVEKITRLLPRSFKLAAAGLDAGRAEVLEELFSQVHKALSFLGGSYEDCRGMGATLTLCWFTPGWLYYAHIGDSRLYYLPASGAGFRQVTQDDTYVGYLLRTGQISEFEARNHHARNALQKALGAGHQFVDPQVGTIGYEPGDRFLLATDGLIDGLFDARLEDALRELPEAGLGGGEGGGALVNHAERLVLDAVRSSGKDNTTAVLIDILPSVAQPSATESR